MIFSNVLKDLRKKNNLTQNQLAEVLGISRSTIAGYENNLNEPDSKMLLKISNYFNISIDFLLGKSSEPRIALNKRALLSKYMYFCIDLLIENLFPKMFEKSYENFLVLFHNSSRNSISNIIDEFISYDIEKKLDIIDIFLEVYEEDERVYISLKNYPIIIKAKKDYLLWLESKMLKSDQDRIKLGMTYSKFINLLGLTNKEYKFPNILLDCLQVSNKYINLHFLNVSKFIISNNRTLNLDTFGLFYYIINDNNIMEYEHIIPGSIMFIQYQNNLNNGDLGVFIEKNSNVIIRKVFINDEFLVFLNNDTDSKPIIISNQNLNNSDFKIIGKVASVISNF